jgi:hypothetical protein
MSKLPKIKHPIHKINIPSLNKEYDFRPFLVKEEKLLLIAKESKSSVDILTAIKQTVNNCLLTDTLDINELALFDLEYIFLKLRAFSVDNIVKISYRDNEDKKVYNFEVDLNEVEIHYPNKKAKNIIEISDNMGLVLKYPRASLYGDKEFLENSKEHMFDLVVRCIDKIYENDEVFEAKNLENKEIEEFLDTLDGNTFKKIEAFLLTTPKIYKTIEYTNEKGKNKKIVLKSLNDFFTWR